MPTISIEVLSVCAHNLELEGCSNGIAFSSSYPPVSDRDPSIWQTHIDSVGGTLVHLFDANRTSARTRWAYDIIREEDWSYFYFHAENKEDWETLLRRIVSNSPVKHAWFYSDAQWSNEAKIVADPLGIPEFTDRAVSNGLVMNTAYKLIL